MNFIEFSHWTERSQCLLLLPPHLVYVSGCPASPAVSLQVTSLKYYYNIINYVWYYNIIITVCNVMPDSQRPPWLVEVPGYCQACLLCLVVAAEERRMAEILRQKWNTSSWRSEQILSLWKEVWKQRYVFTKMKRLRWGANMVEPAAYGSTRWLSGRMFSLHWTQRELSSRINQDFVDEKLPGTRGECSLFYTKFWK